MRQDDDKPVREICGDPTLRRANLLPLMVQEDRETKARVLRYSLSARYGHDVPSRLIRRPVKVGKGSQSRQREARKIEKEF